MYITIWKKNSVATSVILRHYKQQKTIWNSHWGQQIHLCVYVYLSPELWGSLCYAVALSWTPDSAGKGLFSRRLSTVSTSCPVQMAKHHLTGHCCWTKAASGMTGRKRRRRKAETGCSENAARERNHKLIGINWGPQIKMLCLVF